MTNITFDLTPILNRDENQRFDRKSVFKVERGKKRRRDGHRMRYQMAAP